MNRSAIMRAVARHVAARPAPEERGTEISNKHRAALTHGSGGGDLGRLGTTMLRKPDRIIGSPSDPYLLRWHLIRRNHWFNVYLHHFMRSDDDRALHSHPWRWNASIILTRGYIEHTPSGQHRRRVGSIVVRRGEAWHRVELDRGPCWTLFLTGQVVREWGFACPQGFVHWRSFASRTADGNEVGKGCDQ